MEPSPGLPSHEAAQYLPGLRRLFDEQQQAEAATSPRLRAAEPAGGSSTDSQPALLSSSASDVGTFGRSSSSILLPTSSALNVRIEAPVEPSSTSTQLAPPAGDAALSHATARQREKRRMTDDDEVEDLLSVSIHEAPPVEAVPQERLDPREHWVAGAAGSPKKPARKGSAEQQQSGSSSQPASDWRSRDGSPERRGFGVGERGGASGQEFSPLRRVLTPAQEESQARAQEKRRQSEELEREFVRVRGSSSSIVSPPLSPIILAATSGARSERSPYQRHGKLGDNNRSLRAASYPDATPAMLAAAAASTSARRTSASRRPASRPLSVDHAAALGQRGRTSSAPISPARENPRVLVSSADGAPREGPSRGAGGTRRALSFTPGTLPDGTLAGTEVPRRTSSQRAHDRSAGHSPTDRRRHTSGSHLGQSPGMLASRWSSGDWYGLAAADERPGSSRLSGEHYGRRSFSTLIASQARAHSRFHLTAWAALRPRLPAQLQTLRPLRFTSVWPRLHHATLLLSSYAQVLATLFLDYNALFVLASLARFPSTPGTEAGWWTAVAVYGACVLVWLFGVLVLWDVLISYGRRWRKSQPEILPIYLRSAAFTLSAIKSYSVYSLLYRVRMRATRRDFFIETCWFQSQNWPTVLTLVPRGIICTVVLSIYRERSDFGPVLGRDPIYFAQDSDALTPYAFTVLLILAAWTAFRTLLLLLSYLGLLFAVGPRSLIDSVDKHASGSEDDEAIRLSDYHSSNGSRRPLVGESPSPLWASEVGVPQAAARTSSDAYPREHVEELGAAATLPAAWRDRAEDRIRDALLEFGPGAPSTQDSNLAHSPRGSLERRADMAEKRRSYLSASGVSAAGHVPVTLASTPLASPQMRRAGSAGAWEHIEGDAASPATRGRLLPSEAKLASAQSSRASSVAPSVALLPPSRASTFGVVTHEPLDATPVPAESQAGGSGRFASFGSATPSFKRAALVAGGGAVSTLAVTDESPQQEPRGEKRPRGSEDSMEFVITPSASGDARLSHISSSSGTSSAGEQGLVLPFPSASTSDVTATPQGRSRERLSDSPPHSGDERRGEGRRSARMERRGTLSPRSMTGDSPPHLQPHSDTRLGRPNRASSSLSSLTESIRGALSRVAMRSGESLTGDGGEGGHTPRTSPPIAAAALAPTQEASESSADPARASTSWWPALVGRRSKSSPPTEVAPLEPAPAPAPPAIEIQRPSSPREGGSLLALSRDQAALPQDDDVAPAPEAHSDEPVPPSPALSLRTIETAASDDSEERRLWATFPDQSRRHPPGLVALEHEQRQLEAAAARQREQREQREQLGDTSERTPRVAAVTDAAAAAAMPSQDAYGAVGSSGSSHAIPILGARSASPDEIAGTQHLSTSPTAQELAVSPSQGGLIPIKEESWNSSLDASSGAPSPTRSHASDAPTGAPQ